MTPVIRESDAAAQSFHRSSELQGSELHDQEGSGLVSKPSSTTRGMLRTPGPKLDELFRTAPSGRIPAGDGEGTLILAPGSALAAPVSHLVRMIAWKGKIFDPNTATLRNKVGPLGTLAVRGKVYVGPSRLDANPAIILDYSRTTRVARWIRDEIREVAPGVFLGLVYLGRFRIFRFVLDCHEEFPDDRTAQ
jgi:hypothetical protein